MPPARKRQAEELLRGASGMGWAPSGMAMNPPAGGMPAYAAYAQVLAEASALHGAAAERPLSAHQVLPSTL